MSLKGSEFVSVNSIQDSLSFFAETAFYSLKDYIIHAGTEKKDGRLSRRTGSFSGTESTVGLTLVSFF